MFSLEKADSIFSSKSKHIVKEAPSGPGSFYLELTDFIKRFSNFTIAGVGQRSLGPSGVRLGDNRLNQNLFGGDDPL